MFQSQKRLYLPRKTLADIRPRDLVKKYRVNMAMFMEVKRIVGPSMRKQTRNGGAIPVETQILACLRLLASGSFQNVIADVGGIAQSSMSRSLKNFLTAICNVADNYIKFPLDNQRWLQESAAFFHSKAKIPGVIGIVDGFHVHLKKPEVNGDVFLNRNNDPTLNVQLVVGAHNVILDVVANWPGSTHDSHMWRLSGIRERLQAKGPNFPYFLLGDSAYPLSPYMITPIRKPNKNKPEENRFNKAHAKTRVLVEQIIGVVKSRWRVLDKTGGKLLYDPFKVAQLALCCSVLHNLRLKHRVSITRLPDPSTLPRNVQGRVRRQFGSEYAKGVQRRSRLISNFK